MISDVGLSFVGFSADEDITETAGRAEVPEAAPDCVSRDGNCKIAI